MNTIDKKLAKFPRQHRSVLPTPIHELPVLSDMFNRHVYCKRDDLTGFGFGGNKSRKLDFLVSDALAQGKDTLLAVGANQSNFCRMVTAFGSANSMDVHLILGGREPAKPTGNLRLNHLLGANCHHVDNSDWETWEEEALVLESKLTRQGRKVYRMPVGGSTAIGALGYVAALSEIMDDEERLNIRFDVIIFASSSAGTQAGLVVGKSIANWPGRLIGISVAKESSQQQKDVLNVAKETAGLLGTTIDTDSVFVDDRYLGHGYAIRTSACEEAVRFFARKCGLFLDYVYTGKAAAGLLDYLKTGRFDPGSHVLFLHTGGNVELFA